MNSIPVDAITLPAIHDAQSIQQALSSVLQAVAAGTLDNTRARILLSALKLAMANLRNLATQPTPEAQQTAPCVTPKAAVTHPNVTQTPEAAPRHFIHGNPDAPSTAFVPASESYIGHAAGLRASLHAAAVSR